MFQCINLFCAGGLACITYLMARFKEIRIVLLVVFLVFPAIPAGADTLRDLHLEWSYDTSLQGLAGYRIYHNGAFLVEIDDPYSLTADLEVLLIDGTNNFTMTAFDMEGKESAQSEPYLVDSQPTNQDENQLPTASIQADVVSGEAPLVVSFDGKGSSDPDGVIAEYFWEMGDGASRFDESFTYTFETSGDYTVRLTVTDDLGGVATTTAAISVSNPLPKENLAPSAVIDSSVLAGNAPLDAVFNGSWSSDPDGSIVSFNWGFGDGTTGSGSQISHEFAREGEYLVTLTVTDNGGKTASASQTISVAAPLPPPNSAPIAEIAVDTLTGAAPLGVLFDGSGSVDNDGQLVSYAWNFGDGETATGIRVSHSYTKAGAYRVLLTVIDDRDATNTASVQIDALEPVNLPPIASPSTVTLDEDSSVSGTLAGQDPERAPLTFSIVGQPVLGTVQLLSAVTGAYVYTPLANAAGSDSFTFTVNDGVQSSGLATVMVNINPVNDVPVAVNDAVTVKENSQIVIDVLSNDSDSDNDLLILAGVGSALHGVVSLQGNLISYVPENNWFGEDSFSYSLSDGNGGISSAQVSVQVLQSKSRGGNKNTSGGGKGNRH